VTITTFSSRQFNQDAGKAKKAAQRGPVFITDRGHPAHVLLTFEAYKKIAGTPTKIADLLAMPDAKDADLVIPPLRDLAQPADLS
jgi:PHD/YefM family antitoxin component YafN of YafNO toxin-antitoxin module